MYIYIHTYLIMYTPFLHAILGPLLNHMITVGTPNRHSGSLVSSTGFGVTTSNTSAQQCDCWSSDRKASHKNRWKTLKEDSGTLSMRGSMFNQPRIFQSLASIQCFPKTLIPTITAGISHPPPGRKHDVFSGSPWTLLTWLSSSSRRQQQHQDLQLFQWEGSQNAELG